MKSPPARRPRDIRRSDPASRSQVFAYRRSSDGCDDLWIVYEKTSGKDLVYLPYWDDDPDWEARAATTARFVVAALNAYTSESGLKKRRCRLHLSSP